METEDVDANACRNNVHSSRKKTQDANANTYCKSSLDTGSKVYYLRVSRFFKIPYLNNSTNGQQHRLFLRWHPRREDRRPSCQVWEQSLQQTSCSQTERGCDFVCVLSRVALWDVVLLIPATLFLIYLSVTMAHAVRRLKTEPRAIFRTFYVLVSITACDTSTRNTLSECRCWGTQTTATPTQVWGSDGICCRLGVGCDGFQCCTLCCRLGS